MGYDVLLSLFQESVKNWSVQKLGKLPILVEFSRCKKEALLQDFTCEVWYESKILCLVLIFTTKRETILKFLNNKFSGRLFNFETLKNLEEVSFSIFKDLVKDLDKSFLEGLERIYMGFDIKDIKFLRSKGLIRSLCGAMFSCFIFRVNGIGEFSLYLTVGPREFLKRSHPPVVISCFTEIFKEKFSVL